MIKIINPSRLTRQSFFKELIQYLDQHEEVTLRAIKQEFAGVANIDRSIEEFIKAGYIKRENKRYYLTLPLWKVWRLCVWIRKSLSVMIVRSIRNC